jgi:transcriptional regulator with XRE-family HTH domain
MTTVPDSPKRDPEAVRRGMTIRVLRGLIGWKLIELAAAVGKTHGYLSKVENGHKKCTDELAVDIAVAVAAAISVPLGAIVSPGYTYEPPADDEADTAPCPCCGATTDEPADAAGQ